MVEIWVVSVKFTIGMYHFFVEHTLSSQHHSFPILHHNEIRDLSAQLMKEACTDVQSLTYSHALSGEHMDMLEWQY